jgi:ornithine cyclodeaminase/alanine dehydrogenase-like protein (mu-crystallin family)
MTEWLSGCMLAPVTQDFCIFLGKDIATMRWIDTHQIRSVLTFPVLVAALEAAHRRPKIEVQDGFLGSEAEQYFVRHAVDRGRFFASKLITSFPANLAGGRLPAVQAVCVLFDGTDGRPLAIMDGTEITYWRTAADSALGAKVLARPDPGTMLIVGAGEMCTWLVRAHRAVRPSIQRVLIWNRTRQRAIDVAAALAKDDIDAEAADDLDDATRAADLISTCTRSHQPLIKGVNLKSGAHLDLVGGYTPDTREADDEAARRALVFVDRRESAFAGVGDILQPIANGSIRESDVLGDLYDLVGRSIAGRRSPGDITFFKNAGGGHLDLITAEAVYRQLADKAC